MNKKIVLIGKSCSGKTELSHILNQKGFLSALSSTTRPIRINEEDGVHYDFVSRENFIQMIEEDKFIEYDEFNSWFYGLTKERYKQCNLLILTPRGLHHLLKKIDRNELLIIYMDTSEEERMKRAKSRGDDFIEVQSRCTADENDFKDYVKTENWDIRLDYKIPDKFKILLDIFS